MDIKAQTSKDQTTISWHRGPPPSIGWWPASVGPWPGIFRWWDGKYWSKSCKRTTSIKVVALRAAARAHSAQKVYWTWRPTDWPDASYT